MLHQEDSYFLAAQVSNLLHGVSLSDKEAKKLFALLFSGKIGVKTEFSLGAVLFLLDKKGVTLGELRGMAQSITALSQPPLLITSTNCQTIAAVGSGKDQFKTINITTAASIVAAGLGAKTIKVGCGAESSAAGTVDILSLLQLNTDAAPGEAQQTLIDTGFCYLSPQNPSEVLFTYYIGRSVLFNPLEMVLPMFIGVKTDGLLYGFARPDTHITGELLLENGYNNVLLVCGENNNGEYFDEISNLGKTTITQVANGKIETYTLYPSDVGIKTGIDKNLAQPPTKEKCAEAVKHILNGEGHPDQNDAIAMNVGALLWVAGIENSLAEATDRAKRYIESGEGWKYFQTLTKGGSI